MREWSTRTTTGGTARVKLIDELATKLADEPVEVEMVAASRDEGPSAAHDDEPVLRRSRLPKPADLRGS